MLHSIPLSQASGTSAAVRDEDDEAGSFVRIEDKFLVPLSKAAHLRAEIEAVMSPDYPHAGTEFTLIESLYLDSPELDFFQNHLNGSSERYKIRLRRYAPNGHWSDEPEQHLELKAKVNGVGKKFRFQLTALQAKELLNGEFLSFTPELLSLNKAMSEKALKKRLGKINEIISVYQIRPNQSVTYHRRAYIHQGIRVTLDENISFRPVGDVSPQLAHKLQQSSTWDNAIAMKSRLIDEPKVIMEIKHGGLIPDWLQNIIQKVNVEETSCSKYCVAITSQVAQEI